MIRVHCYMDSVCLNDPDTDGIDLVMYFFQQNTHDPCPRLVFNNGRNLLQNAPWLLFASDLWNVYQAALYNELYLTNVGIWSIDICL